MQKLKNNEPRPKFTGSYIKKRVPQGTVLAPLLFLLFIDDIETNIDFLNAPFCRRVSRTQSYKERFELSTAAGRYFLVLSLGKHMEDDLQQVKVSCHAYDTQENLWEVPLVPTNPRKYLGVQLTSNLDMGTHVQQFQTRLTNRSLGLLQRHLKHCSPSIKETVVKALVQPQMDNCSSIWNSNEWLIWQH